MRDNDLNHKVVINVDQHWIFDEDLGFYRSYTFQHSLQDQIIENFLNKGIGFLGKMAGFFFTGGFLLSVLASETMTETIQIVDTLIEGNTVNKGIVHKSAQLFDIGFPKNSILNKLPHNLQIQGGSVFDPSLFLFLMFSPLNPFSTAKDTIKVGRYLWDFLNKKKKKRRIQILILIFLEIILLPMKKIKMITQKNLFLFLFLFLILLGFLSVLYYMNFFLANLAVGFLSYLLNFPLKFLIKSPRGKIFFLNINKFFLLFFFSFFFFFSKKILKVITEPDYRNNMVNKTFEGVDGWRKSFNDLTNQFVNLFKTQVEKTDKAQQENVKRLTNDNDTLKQKNKTLENDFNHEKDEKNRCLLDTKITITNLNNTLHNCLEKKDEYIQAFNYASKNLNQCQSDNEEVLKGIGMVRDSFIRNNIDTKEFDEIVNKDKFSLDLPTGYIFPALPNIPMEGGETNNEKK
uniref:Uncharacterized protein n=1 Tax=Mallomonas splendens TaxID=52552 RepID=A0A3G2QZP8_9STRA|nr:hypothetical protein [Mallomonas splendens]AYO28597.1 hypothetical protein [Mallomonas splendens]